MYVEHYVYWEIRRTLRHVTAPVVETRLYVKLERFTVQRCLRKIAREIQRDKQKTTYRKIVPVGRLGWLAPARQSWTVCWRCDGSFTRIILSVYIIASGTCDLPAKTTALKSKQPGSTLGCIHTHTYGTTQLAIVHMYDYVGSLIINVFA